MHFFIDADTGHSIGGWLIPDNPADVPSFSISIPDRQEIVFRANVLRADVRELGMHPTGMVGFSVDEDMVPDLADLHRVTIFELESGLPIYRRFRAEEDLESKLLLIEIGAMPQIKILRRIMRHYTLNYPMIERLPLETTLSVLDNHFVPSLFVSGQPNWARVGGLVLNRGYITAALLRDPFEELAERLLFLSLLKKQAEGTTGSSRSLLERNAILLPILDALADDRALLSAFRMLSADQRRLLRSPMTAVFGCTPEEEPQRRSVSAALDNLAQFHVVGVQRHFAEFGRLVNGIVGAPLFADDLLSTLPGTADLAAKLASIGLVADILDEDIALHSFTTEAVEAALGSGGDEEDAR